MIFVTLILLILLGVLGIASWLKTRQPNLNAQIGKLESFEGWIGLVGLVWGLILLLRWLQSLGYFSYAPGYALIGLITVLVVISLSLILSIPVLRNLFGSNNFTTKLGELAGKLGPYKIGLGFACLVLAVYLLVTLASVHTAY